MKKRIAALAALTMLGAAMTLGTALAELPVTQFATKEQLMQYSDGPLATGGEKDVKLRIQFGRRESNPITWLLAGAEENGLVLYSEAPLIDGTAFNSKGNDNNWAESDLREKLGKLAKSDDIFSDAEQRLIRESVITTQGTTYDRLYAPAGNYESTYDTSWITVGEGNLLKIDCKYWAGEHWLRSPYPNNDRYALVTYVVSDGGFVNYMYVNYNTAAAAAMGIDMNNVLFASAASGIGDWNSTIVEDAPMTLRLAAGSEKQGTVTVGADGRTVTAENAEDGTRMVVQYENGQVFRPVIMNGTAEIRVPEGTKFRAWLEWDVENGGGGTLTYARMAENAGSNPGNDDDEGDPTPEEGDPTPDDALAAGENLPKTGDPSSLMGWVCLLGAAGAGLAYMRKARKN